MDEVHATSLADKIIIALIQHQPEMVGKATLLHERSSQDLARGIAALRLELVERLKTQPG